MKSIKEKAEAYDKVLEWATEAHKVCDGMLKEDLEHLFPELKESEDERIRKAIINVFATHKDYEIFFGVSVEDILAWLEAQGEQKPAELPKGEDYGIDGLYAAVDILQKTLGSVDGYQSDDGILEHKCAITAVKKLYEQKPADTEKGAKGNDREIPNSEPPLTIKHAREVMGIKQDTAWSEEDERMMMFCCDYLDDNQKSWLLSLKERCTWKPSDEQIRELGIVATGKGWFSKEILSGLLEQLMKFRRE